MFYKPEHSAAFLDWLKKPAGASLLKLECHEVNTIAAKLFGYDAVVLGEAAFVAGLQQSSIKRQIIVNQTVIKDASGYDVLRCRYDKLAIDTETVDLVYIAHALEYSNNPYDVLLEAYRILRPDGHLIVSMLNPFSLLGMWRHLAKWGKNSAWKANFMSSVKLKDWLGLLGFDIMRVNHFGYYLPDSAMLERYGKDLKAPFGAAYVLEASKKVISLTPMKPVWSSDAKIVNNDLTEPTT